MEITSTREMTMTKLKIAVVAVLLIASAPAFAQRATVGQSTPSAHASQETGPFENMSRPE
jgi:hypothetical protein